MDVGEKMDFMLFLQAFLALAFVLGLAFIVFWAMKWCEAKGCKILLNNKGSSSRLTVLERKRLDAKNTLVAVKCDDEEYLLLLGNNNLLLKSKKANKNV